MKLDEKYKVKSIKKYLCKEWLLKKHYAKRIPSISYSFGLFEGDLMVGCCTFGSPANVVLLECCGDKYKDNVLELNRLIKNDGLEKNVQSWFVSKCFKMLPKPMIVVSYADPNNGHHGYTYQALNFLYTGKSSKKQKYVYDGKEYHNRTMTIEWFKGKGIPYDKKRSLNDNFKIAGGEIQTLNPKNRYIYFLGNKRQKKDMRRKLTYPVLEYPKGDNENYDTSYNPSTQTELF